MKIKRVVAAVLSLALAMTMLAGCQSKKDQENAAAQEAYESALSAWEEKWGQEQEEPIVEEPDFLGYLTGVSDVDFYNMSFEEFVEATGGKCTAENAVSYNEDSSGVVRYYFGKKDSILCGRLKLPKECDVYCTLTFKKNKLKEMTIKADGFTEAEAVALCDDFMDMLDGKLPEGYEPVTPSGNGGNFCIVGYGKGNDDFLVLLKRNYFSGDFYIEFSLDVNSERYE